MKETVSVQPSDSEVRSSPWAKRLLVAFIVLLPFGLLLQVYIYFRMAGGSELAAAIAEADRLDPGWRLEEIEAKRKVIPEAENSARLVTRLVGAEHGVVAGRMLPSGWSGGKFWEALKDPDLAERPLESLNEQQAKLLGGEMKKVEAILHEARKLKDMPHGRYPIEYKPDYLSMLLPYTQKTREASNLLRMDVLWLTHEGKLDEALASLRAAVNVSRAIGDEPTLISQLVRIACRSIAVQNVERVLAQGSPSEGALAALQKQLEADVKEPLLLYGVRGERAASDWFLRQLQTGEISTAYFMRAFSSGAPAAGWTGNQTLDDLIATVGVMVIVGPVKKNRADLLDYNNHLVEVAKMPLEKQREEFAKVGGRSVILARRRVTQLLAPAIEKVAEAQYRSVSQMNYTIAGLAAERFRLKHSRWPDSITDLVPEFLVEVPLDPYQPGGIKLKRLPDGVVIYSAAWNRKDDGGSLDRKKAGHLPNSDTGIRLWDADKRRQPAKTPPGKSTDEEEP